MFPLAAALGRAAAPVPAYSRRSGRRSGPPGGDKERDANRKPAETLLFAGIAPGQQIAELLPGGGYFTRIMAKPSELADMSMRWCRRLLRTHRRTPRISQCASRRSRLIRIIPT